VKQSHRMSKGSKRSVEKLPSHVCRENVFKEIGRKSREDDVLTTPRYGAAENRAASPKASSATTSHASSNIVFKSPCDSENAAIVDADDRVVETQGRKYAAAMNELGKTNGVPSTKHCEDGSSPAHRHSETPSIRTDPPSSARLGESNQQRATASASGSSNTSQQITPFGAGTLNHQQGDGGADDNSSYKTDELSPLDVNTPTMEKMTTIPAIEPVDPCNFPMASTAPKATRLEKAAGKGANRTKRNHPRSTENSLKKTNTARPRQIPWTAELAGRTYRALGINVAPVFKLNDGRSYRHPPLPPGWTIGVSRSRNTPFYIHQDFGSTFFCPVLLPSGDGRVVGTTMLFETDTPMMGSVQSFGSISPPSETRITPAIFGSSSPEQLSQCHNESNFVVRPVTANAKAADAMYSELEHTSKPQETGELENKSGRSHGLEESAQSQNCSSQGDKAFKSSWKVGAQGATPIGAFAVAANAMYSSVGNFHHESTGMSTARSAQDDEVEQSACGSERLHDSDIPLVVEVVTKSGSRKAPLGGEAQSPTDRQEDFQANLARFSRQNGGSDQDRGLISKTVNKTTAEDDLTAATSLNLSDDSEDSPCSSPPNFVWFGSENGCLLDDSEDRAVVRQQCSRDTPSFKLASASNQTEDQTSLQKAYSTSSKYSSEKEETGFDIAAYASRCNDSPPRLSTNSSSVQKQSSVETVFPAENVATDNCSPEGDAAVAFDAASDGDFPECDNETGPVHSDGDFPPDGTETASVASDGDFPEAATIPPPIDDDGDLSPSKSSLPVKVIFGSETSDDDVSRLESTPVQKQKRRTKISTRFDPTAIPLTDPHRGRFPTVLEGGDYYSIPCGDDDSNDSSTITSRSYMSSVSTLSRVSHHVLHPIMPLCCLQNLDALPVCKKKRKKTTKNKKTKKRAKRSVPVSA